MGVDYEVCNWCFEATVEFDIECIEMRVPGKQKRFVVAVCSGCQERALPLLEDKDSDGYYEFSPDFLQRIRLVCLNRVAQVFHSLKQVAAP